jgi:hypothetical protein
MDIMFMHDLCSAEGGEAGGAEHELRYLLMTDFDKLDIVR